jgi:hypothetical protein
MATNTQIMLAARTTGFDFFKCNFSSNITNMYDVINTKTATIPKNELV